jgi:hypothetical protein
VVPGVRGWWLIKEIKARGKGEDTYRRRKNNKGHKQKCLQNNIDIHLRNTEGRRLGTVSRIIMTAGEFKPINGALDLALSPTMFL